MGVLETLHKVLESTQQYLEYIHELLRSHPGSHDLESNLRWRGDLGGSQEHILTGIANKFSIASTDIEQYINTEEYVIGFAKGGSEALVGHLSRPLPF
jgi:hypothetical protein